MSSSKDFTATENNVQNEHAPVSNIELFDLTRIARQLEQSSVNPDAAMDACLAVAAELRRLAGGW